MKNQLTHIVLLPFMFSTLVFTMLLPSTAASMVNDSKIAGLTGEDDNLYRRPSNEDDELLFLPIIIAPEPPQSKPIKLISPGNGAILDTLIPVLVFETGEVPDDTGGCIAFSTVPDPTGCKSSFGLRDNHRRERVLWYNLKANTMYYWRVGTAYNYDFSNIEWSEQWTFTTGPSGGVILAAPQLVTPPDGAVVSASNLVLQWQSVVGAVEYDVTIHDRDEDRWYGISGIYPPNTKVGPGNLAWIFDFAQGSNFSWNVVARNDYAWGTESDFRDFSLSDKNYNENMILHYDDLAINKIDEGHGRFEEDISE